MSSNVCRSIIDILEMTESVYGPIENPSVLGRDLKRAQKIMERSHSSKDAIELEHILRKFMYDANTGKAYMDWVRNRLSGVRTDWCHNVGKTPRSRRSRSPKAEPSTPVKTPTSSRVVRRLFDSLSPRNTRKRTIDENEESNESPPSLLKQAGLVPRPPPGEFDRMGRHRRRNFVNARRRHSGNLRERLIRSASASRKHSARRSKK